MFDSTSSLLDHPQGSLGGKDTKLRDFSQEGSEIALFYMAPWQTSNRSAKKTGEMNGVLAHVSDYTAGLLTCHALRTRHKLYRLMFIDLFVYVIPHMFAFHSFQSHSLYNEGVIQTALFCHHE